MLELSLEAAETPIVRADGRHPDANSARIRALIAQHPMDAEPHIFAPVSFLMRLYLRGDVVYAFDAVANEIWNDWLPSGAFWHELTATRCRLAFHVSDLGAVAVQGVAKGYKVEVRGS